MKKGLTPNLLDRAISLINPAAGLRRLQARAASQVVENHGNVRRYEAATMGRRTEGWFTQSTGPNAEGRQAVRLLRDRMRDLVRNNPYAKRASKVITTSVVGTGIRPAPVGLSKGATKKLREAWRKWAESPNCDHEGRTTFYGLQRLGVRGNFDSGEVLVVRRRLGAADTAKNGGVPIQLQMLESDFLDSAKDMHTTTNGDYCIQGVQYNRNGKRTGYWLFNRHPGDAFILGTNQSEFVPAEDVLHIYEAGRIGQSRGVPMGASAMLRLMDLDGYEDAQLLRQKIAACYVAFVSNASEDADNAMAAATGKEIDYTTLPTELQPGTVERLPSGSTVTLSNPPPAEGYDEYMRRNLQGVAGGLGVTYEQLTGDLSNVNFTSGRMGRLEFEQWITEFQEDVMLTQFCIPVWRWFVQAMWQTGQLASNDVEVKFVLPARKMVDPVKEIKATTDAVRAGLLLWEDAVLREGKDPDEQLAAIAAMAAKMKEHGVVITTDATQYTSAGNKILPPGPQGPTGEALASV